MLVLGAGLLVHSTKVDNHSVPWQMMAVVVVVLAYELTKGRLKVVAPYGT